MKAESKLLILVIKIRSPVQREGNKEAQASEKCYCWRIKITQTWVRLSFGIDRLQFICMCSFGMKI